MLLIHSQSCCFPPSFIPQCFTLSELCRVTVTSFVCRNLSSAAVSSRWHPLNQFHFQSKLNNPPHTQHAKYSLTFFFHICTVFCKCNNISTDPWSYTATNLLWLLLNCLILLSFSVTQAGYRCSSSSVWTKIRTSQTPACSSAWTSTVRGSAGRSARSWRSRRVRRICAGPPPTRGMPSRWTRSSAAPSASWSPFMLSCRSLTHTLWSRALMTTKVEYLPWRSGFQTTGPLCSLPVLFEAVRTHL